MATVVTVVKVVKIVTLDRNKHVCKTVRQSASPIGNIWDSVGHGLFRVSPDFISFF